MYLSSLFASTLVVSRYWDLKALFRLEEGVRESDVGNILEEWVLAELGVDVKKDGEVHLFARIESLLLETEALNFVEIGGDVEGDHVISRYAYDGLIQWIFGLVKSERRFAGSDRDRSLLRLKVPHHGRVSVGVELNFQDCVLHLSHGSDHLGIVTSLDVAAEARRLAEHFIERYRSVGEAGHQDDRRRRVHHGAGVVLLSLRLPILGKRGRGGKRPRRRSLWSKLFGFEKDGDVERWTRKLRG
jgi:hypothetical protein